ncbi:MAG: PspC domain-containing protein [Xanthomonadales bacterium]|nr:PspC domain-containing protein [Xanthomonadales bacterium]
MSGNRNKNPQRRLYRDVDNGKLAGVCAGIAVYFGFNLKSLRLVWGIAFLFFWPALIYLVLALLIPRKPENLFASEAQENFYRGVNSDPRQLFGDLRLRFRDLDMRLQKMETHVTSRSFDFDQELGRETGS